MKQQFVKKFGETISSVDKCVGCGEKPFNIFDDKNLCVFPNNDIAQRYDEYQPTPRIEGKSSVEKR